MGCWGLKEPSAVGVRWGRTKVQGQIWRWAVIPGCPPVSFAFLDLFILPSLPCLPFSLPLSLSKNIKAEKKLQDYDCCPNFLSLYLEIKTEFLSLSDFILLSLSPAVALSLNLSGSLLPSFHLYLVTEPALMCFSLCNPQAFPPKASVSKPILCIKSYWKTPVYPRNGWVGILPHESRSNLGSENKRLGIKEQPFQSTVIYSAPTMC